MTSPIPRARRPRQPNGFTLVEVLAAFMILAVGLLALEALSIGAARMVTRAERLSEYNTLAVSELESTLSALRQGETPATETFTVPQATMERQVTQDATNPRFFTVRILVRPQGDQVLVASDSFSVTGNVLR